MKRVKVENILSSRHDSAAVPPNFVRQKQFQLWDEQRMDMEMKFPVEPAECRSLASMPRDATICLPSLRDLVIFNRLVPKLKHWASVSTSLRDAVSWNEASIGALEPRYTGASVGQEIRDGGTPSVPWSVGRRGRWIRGKGESPCAHTADVRDDCRASRARMAFRHVAFGGE